MAQISVTIGGRAYRLACSPGEEQHLESLSKLVDSKIIEMRASFGEIGDQRLVVMAALTIADELHEVRRLRDQRTEADAAALAHEIAAREAAHARAEALNAEIHEMSLRIETLAAALANPPRD